MGLGIGRSGIWWAAALAVAVGALLTLPWEQSIDSELVRDTTYDTVGANSPVDNAVFTRTAEWIDSHGTRIEAWVYIPKGLSNPPPVIVMAHGLGAQKDIGLPAYADRLAKRAMAVVVFDYRTFGGSDGEPRHWVSAARHLEDYLAVVDHIQATNLGGRVDGSRLALWGISYSGGHSLVTASRLGDRIKAVVANEPYLRPPNPYADRHFSDPTRSLRLLAASLSDRLRHALGWPPVYVRLAAPMSEGALALVPLKDSDLAHFRPQGGGVRHYQGGWKNKVLARMVLETLTYRPASDAGRITAPVFLRAALRDHLTPPEAVREVAERIGSKAVLHEIDASHVEAHPMGIRPEHFEPLISFLHSSLGVSDENKAAAADRAQEAEEAAAQAQAAEGGKQKEPAVDDIPEGQFPETE